MTEKWKYYNHALIPTTEPHEEIPFDKSIFKGTKAILARWTS